MAVLELERLSAPGPIEAYLRRTTALHVYALADLDARFWGQTRWYGLRSKDTLHAVAFVFEALDPPLLYGVSRPRDVAMQRLLHLLAGELPPTFHGALGPGLDGSLTDRFAAGPGRRHHKMALQAARLSATPSGVCQRLTAAQLDEVQAFYAAHAYGPGEEIGRFFAPYMLEIGPFYGIRERGRLVAAGGFHVHSTRRRVAALGNVATSPAHRGRGHGRRITTALCNAVREDVDWVGLNVGVDNEPAIGLYRSLGFHIVGGFVERRFSRLGAAISSAPPAGDRSP